MKPKGLNSYLEQGGIMKNTLIELFPTFIGLFAPKMVEEHELDKTHDEAIIKDILFAENLASFRLRDLAESGKRISIRVLGQMLEVAHPRSHAGKAETKRRSRKCGFVLRQSRNPKLYCVA